MGTGSPPPRRSYDRHYVHYVTMGRDRRFVRLRRRLTRFSIISIGGFLCWYFLYVAMSAFAREFMDQRVIGNVNVGLVFGLLEFVATFLLAWGYAHYARAALDPLADRIRTEIDSAPDPRSRER